MWHAAVVHIMPWIMLQGGLNFLQGDQGLPWHWPALSHSRPRVSSSIDLPGLWLCMNGMCVCSVHLMMVMHFSRAMCTQGISRKHHPHCTQYLLVCCHVHGCSSVSTWQAQKHHMQQSISTGSELCGCFYLCLYIYSLLTFQIGTGDHTGPQDYCWLYVVA